MPFLPYSTQHFIPGEVSHLYNRAYEKGALVCYSEDNFESFLRRYFERMTDYCDIYAYCILPYHYHFDVRIKDTETILQAAARDLKQLSKDTLRQLGLAEDHSKEIRYYLTIEDENLTKKIVLWAISEQFRHFNMSYVKALNKQINRRGSLIQKRFRRKLFRGIEDIQRLLHYIHFNPIHHGW